MRRHANLHIWITVAQEYGRLVSTSTARDISTVTSRIEHEGEQFLTLTLPAFGAAFDGALEAGLVTRQTFPGFSPGRRGPLPKFLGGFLSRVFDPETGSILKDVDPIAVEATRQLCHMFGKLEGSCSPQKVEAAYRDYVRVDKEVGEHARFLELDHELGAVFRRYALALFGPALDAVECTLDELVPRHGSGATAEKLSVNARWRQSEWTERLEQAGFTYTDYALPSHSYWSNSQCVDYLTQETERPVRVIDVPKTAKSPRLIAIEPAAQMYAQQAVMRRLVPLLEAQHVPWFSGVNPCTGFLGFSDQTPNQAMAERGSRDGTLATLDLSEASDRVSVWHVNELLHYHPRLRELVFAARSTRADVPGEGLISLSKFASMGSALTFPLEAMVFTTVAMMGIVEDGGIQALRSRFNELRGSVRVYGDDIVVPVDSVHDVIDRLETYGFKVNRRKSFWASKLRESCGADWYDGHRVTPIRVRRNVPHHITDVPGILALVSLRNQFYNAGLWFTASRLDDMIAPLLKGHYPAVVSTSAVLGRESFLGVEKRTVSRIHRDRHVPLVRGYVQVSKSPEDTLDDWPALLKWFCLRAEEPLDIDHLEYAGRPHAVRLKRGWHTPY